MKLFDEHLPFLRANFHCHTTRSDGHISPAECMRRYRDAGYDVLAITDHRTVTMPEEVPEGLTLVPGVELDYFLPGMAVHIVGLGVPADLPAAWDPNGRPQEAIDLIRRCGGEAILAHPAWSLNTPAFMAGLNNLAAVEVYNSVSTFPMNVDRADSSVLLDAAGAAHGWILPFVASDDSHGYHAEFAQGWTMLQAREPGPQGVLEALRQGRFYASRGPRFCQIEICGTQVRVTCEPVETIAFVTNMPWGARRVVTGHGLTEAAYTCSPDDRFLRVELVDGKGRKAWSRPVWVPQAE